MKTFAAILLLGAAAFTQSLSVAYQDKTASVDISKLPHERLKTTDPHDKSEHSYSCVSLAPFLAAAAVPQKDKLHGKALSLVVVASAKDNYHAAFSLAELDETVGPTKAYVCDALDGKPLPESEAPLKLLVTTDKHPSRSVRMLTGITVKSAEVGPETSIADPDHSISSESQQDEAAIRKVISDNTEAFNHHDPAALGSHLAPDADHIGVTGAWTSTRQAFQDSLKDYFSSPKPTTSDKVASVRFPKPDVAIAIVKRQYVSATGTRDSVSTYVLIKQDGTWWITAFQNTFVQKN